jgi:hypothetical protein
MELGTPVRQPTAGVRLDDLGFAKRQIETTIAGGNVPERQQQLSLLHLQARLTRTGQSFGHQRKTIISFVSCGRYFF